VIPAVVTAAALIAALCWLLRARRLRAERDRISAELDQAHAAGAALAADCNHWIDVAFLTKRRLTSRWLTARLEIDRLRAELAAVDEGHAAFVSALAEEFEAQGEQAVELALRVTELEDERAREREAAGIGADDLTELEEIARSAAEDVAGYTTPRGTMATYDDRRVGRMLARDPVIARVLPGVIAELRRRRAAELSGDVVARRGRS
jgi:hypothetical protein